MRFANLFISGLGRRLPDTMTMEEADANGLCSRRAVWRTNIASVCVSVSESGPEMAALAGRAALAQAGRSAEELDLVLHASIYFQGHDLWTPASYVQREVGGGSAPAIEIGQMSNGGMAAIELAAGYLAAEPSRHNALVTTGDRFSLPGVDRWRSDPGTVLGDGGTAAVLSTTDGHVRVHSVSSWSDSGLEQLQRGSDPFGTTPLTARIPIDVEAHRRTFVASTGLDALLERIDLGQRAVVKQALSEAGMDLADLDWFVPPTLGRSRLDEQFLRKFDIDPDRTTWSWGRTVGHLGAGDQIAGLAHLVETGRLRPGQFCLLASVGAGFSWSCAVVELLRHPEQHEERRVGPCPE